MKKGMKKKGMKKKGMKKMIKTVEAMGWGVEVEKDVVLFKNCSPAGQDITMEVDGNTVEDIANHLKEYCDDFDCSERAYQRMDNSGHGINGAPENMKDLYEDMEAVLKMLESLKETLQQIYKEMN